MCIIGVLSSPLCSHIPDSLVFLLLCFDPAVCQKMIIFCIFTLFNRFCDLRLLFRSATMLLNRLQRGALTDSTNKRFQNTRDYCHQVGIAYCSARRTEHEIEDIDIIMIAFLVYTWSYLALWINLALTVSVLWMTFCILGWHAIDSNKCSELECSVKIKVKERIERKTNDCDLGYSFGIS